MTGARLPLFAFALSAALFVAADVVSTALQSSEPGEVIVVIGGKLVVTQVVGLIVEQSNAFRCCCLTCGSVWALNDEVELLHRVTLNWPDGGVSGSDEE